VASSPRRAEADEKIEKGGVKIDFTPFPLKLTKSFTKIHRTSIFAASSSFFRTFASIIFAFPSSHSSKCHLHLIYLCLVMFGALFVAFFAMFVR